MEHNMEALRERFGKLLDTLCNDFGLCDYVDGRCPEDIDCEWEGYNDAADHLGIWTSTGATKFVIGDEDCDYIIKFCPCSGDFDYCAREVEVYEEAVRAGYADKFAWCAKLFDYDFNGSFCLPVYVMEWCQCGYDQIDDEMDDWHYTKFCTSNGLKKTDDDAWDKYYDSKDRCRNWSERLMEWAYDCWGLDFNAPSMGDSIADFMRKMYINDIHPGNWGWHDNKLVLVDYSGYGECFSCRSIDY